MELWRYYRILRRRKWLVIIGTLICVSIVAIALYIRPQKWEGYTKVIEKTPGDEKVAIYTTPYMYQLEPKLRLTNLIQLVKSRTVLERSADTLLRLGITTDPAQILSTLTVEPVLDSTFLSIKVQSSSEEEAITTADVVTAEFIRFYNEMNYGGAEKTKEFIQKELPKAEAKLRRVRQEMRQFKEESGAVMLPHQTDALIQQVTQLQTSAAQYQVQTQQSRAKISGLEQKLKDIKAFPAQRVTSTVVSSNPVWQSLQIELAKQQIELQKMMKDRTLEHPDVKVLQQQIAETQKELHNAGDKILNSTTEATNPIRDNLVQNYILAMVDYVSADAARSAAQDVIGSLQPEMRALPEQEMRLAQLTVDLQAAENTYSLLNQKLDEATIREQEAENASTIQIVDSAKSRPADTRRTMKLLLAILLSPIFCSGVAFLLNYLDNTIKTPAEAEELLKLPIFAVVPIADTHLLAEGKDMPALGTSYQMLSSNFWIEVDKGELQGKTVLIASAEPDVGRSITAANLAITLARDGARVILVDSDLRQPSLHSVFGVDNETGLSNVLVGKMQLKDALKPTAITDLLLLPSGPIPANPIRLLRSPEMASFVKTVNELADFVIFDSPAGITFADSIVLASLAKNVVIVHAAGTVSRGAEEEFSARLSQVNANVLGAVLNMVRPEDSHGYYHFRSAYEELMDGRKHPGSPHDRMLGPIPEDKEEKTNSTES